jgi:hypothetical protein
MRSLPDGGQLRLRVRHDGRGAVLELHAPSARWQTEPQLELTAITESLEADGGRLFVPASCRGEPLRVAWTMAS